VSLGVQQTMGWRLAMIVPGVMMLIVAVMYWRLTQDTPEGNFKELRARGISVDSGKKGGWAVFKQAMVNYRVWMLAITYGACFGVEIFIHGAAASYYVERFGLNLETAGLAAGSFGLLALFARALGGIASDKIAGRFGLDGRTWLLFGLLVGEGVGLLAFSSMDSVALAVMAFAEMFAGTDGLGFFIIFAQATYRIAEMYSGVFVLGLLGYAVNLLFLLVERRILAWHRGWRATAQMTGGNL
jgi:NNP family nitrate/nitrite transporter-like MFS transporter